jgi:hypothetical protein
LKNGLSRYCRERLNIGKKEQNENKKPKKNKRKMKKQNSGSQDRADILCYLSVVLPRD